MKDFNDWHKLKIKVEARARLATFREREIWWANIGENVGHEEDRKNGAFSRPILIVRKFNAHLFWGVPMTTQIKDNPYYYPVDFKGKQQSVMLSQLRAWDAKRLTDILGTLPEPEFKNVKKALGEIIMR